MVVDQGESRISSRVGMSGSCGALFMVLFFVTVPDPPPIFYLERSSVRIREFVKRFGKMVVKRYIHSRFSEVPTS